MNTTTITNRRSFLATALAAGAGVAGMFSRTARILGGEKPQCDKWILDTIDSRGKSIHLDREIFVRRLGISDVRDPAYAMATRGEYRGWLALWIMYRGTETSSSFRWLPTERRICFPLLKTYSPQAISEAIEFSSLTPEWVQYLKYHDFFARRMRATTVQQRRAVLHNNKLLQQVRAAFSGGDDVDGICELCSEPTFLGQCWNDDEFHDACICYLFSRPIGYPCAGIIDT